MTRPRIMARRSLAILAVLALLLATTAYLSHVDEPGHHTSGHGTHCELCLQWAGAAGTPTPPTLVLTSWLSARIPTALHSDTAPSRRQFRSHRSRAPPFST